ncbi:MAG: V-type ATP synthase subunit F [Thaumarchaeota archaeon]|nr:V-type ATP synthase subunit F [Nitrososphaerota archaeon]
MKAVTVGNKIFVTAFQLAGIQGKIVENSEQALSEVNKLIGEKVGLILISDDIANPINDQLTLLRSKNSVLVFSLPHANSKKENIDYRLMLKKILGV